MVLRVLWVFGVLRGLISQACRKYSPKHVNKRSYASGFLKAEVVDENILRTTLRSDLVCVPNMVVVSPAVLAKHANKQTDGQTSNESYLLDLGRFQLCVLSGQLCSEPMGETQLD